MTIPADFLICLAFAFATVALLVVLHVFQGPPPKEPPSMAEWSALRRGLRIDAGPSAP